MRRVDEDKLPLPRGEVHMHFEHLLACHTFRRRNYSASTFAGNTVGVQGLACSTALAKAPESLDSNIIVNRARSA